MNILLEAWMVLVISFFIICLQKSGDFLIFFSLTYNFISFLCADTSLTVLWHFNLQINTGVEKTTIFWPAKVYQHFTTEVCIFAFPNSVRKTQRKKKKILWKTVAELCASPYSQHIHSYPVVTRRQAQKRLKNNKEYWLSFVKLLTLQLTQKTVHKF